MDPRHGGGRENGGGLARGGLSEPVLSLPKGYFLSRGLEKESKAKCEVIALTRVVVRGFSGSTSP